MSGSNAANEAEPPRDVLDPVLLDRLVDGELAEAERRKLLLSLDHQPSGWRQCALAFLEAQSWRELFGAAAKKPIAATAAAAQPNAGGAGAMPAAAAAIASAAPIDPAQSAEAGIAEPRFVRPRRGLPRHWLWVVEMAASFLVAFSLGLWIRGGFLTTTTGRPAVPLAGAPAGAGNSMPATLQVVAPGRSGSMQQMQVPLVDASRLQWWQSQPAAALPDEVRRAIERAGGQIRQERRYFPVELPDGRRALVPVDQIEVVPPGNQGMQ